MAGSVIRDIAFFFRLVGDSTASEFFGKFVSCPFRLFTSCELNPEIDIRSVRYTKYIALNICFQSS